MAIYGNIDSTTRITGFTIQNGIGCVYGQGGGIYVESASPDWIILSLRIILAVPMVVASA